MPNQTGVVYSRLRNTAPLLFLGGDRPAEANAGPGRGGLLTQYQPYQKNQQNQVFRQPHNQIKNLSNESKTPNL
jgi:hypothetical protein